MAVNSRHNVYTSIPDWFSQSNSKTATPTPQLTVKRVIYTGGQSVPTSSGISEINLFNKFVIVETQLDIEILTNTDTALIAIKTDEKKVGELVTAEGWATSDYLAIAAGTLLLITATAHNNYGVVFYDNTQTVIQGNVVDPLGSELTVPANARYFRVCSTADDETFSLIYNTSECYSKEQLLESDSNILNYTQLNPNIPEGIESIKFNNSSLKLLVQEPLQLNKDVNNVVKLSLDAEAAGIGGAWEIKVDENTELKYIFTKYPVATQYGITMYADEDNLVLPDIYAGLPHDNTIVRKEDGTFGIPIDNSTIVLDNGKLTALGGITGGAASEVAWANVKGKPTWLEDDVIKFNEVVGLSDKLDEYVTLRLDEDIEGVKDFLNGIMIDGISILKYQDDVLYINSNLIVRGSITMYVDDTVDIPSLMESIQTDGTTIINDKGTLKLNPNLLLGGGGISSLVIKVGQDSYNGIGTEDVTVTLPSFVKSSDFSNLVQNEMNNYASDKYVTRTGDEDITGVHPFVNGLKIGTSLINQSQEDVIFIDANVVVRGGITMYADNGTLDIPGIYDAFPHDDTIVKTDGVFGIPIDNETIVLDNGKLTVMGGGTSGGAASEIAWVNVKGKPTWLEDDVVNITDVAGLPIELLKYAKLEDLNAYLPLTGGTVEYLNVNTDLKIGDILLLRKSDSVLYLDGNLVVKGGITMYGVDPIDIPSLIDSLPVASTKEKGVAYFDPDFFSVSNDGKVSFIGKTGGGLDIVSLQNYLTQNSYLNTTQGDNRYLKLSGGDLNGALVIKTSVLNPLTVYSNGMSYKSYIYYQNGASSGNDMGGLGFSGKNVPSFKTNSTDGGKEYKLIHENNYSSYALPLSGGVVKGVTTINGNTKTSAPLEIETPGMGYSGYIKFANGGTTCGYLGMGGIDKPVFRSSAAINYTLWHSGNDGADSGLDADLLDGLQSADFARSYKAASVDNSLVGIGYDNKSMGSVNLPTAGGFISATQGKYGFQLLGEFLGTSLFFRGVNNGAFSNWKTIAFTDSNVASATKLQTARTIWGQSFDGTGNVSGDMTGVGTMSLSGDLTSGSYGSNCVAKFQGIGIGDGYYSVVELITNNEVSISYSNNSRYSDSKRWSVGRASSNSNYRFNFWNASYNGAVSYIDLNGNFWVAGGITMYSDLRKKTILNNVELSLELIANAPIIEYYYNNDELKTTHVGSSAQYWAEINDWFCKEDNDGYYTMELQNLALASSISVARELVRYESNTDKQIRELKEKIIELENRLKQYEYGSNT